MILPLVHRPSIFRLGIRRQSGCAQIEGRGRNEGNRQVAIQALRCASPKVSDQAVLTVSVFRLSLSFSMLFEETSVFLCWLKARAFCVLSSISRFVTECWTEKMFRKKKKRGWCTLPRSAPPAAVWRVGQNATRANPHVDVIDRWFNKSPLPAGRLGGAEQCATVGWSSSQLPCLRREQVQEQYEDDDNDNGRARERPV